MLKNGLIAPGQIQMEKPNRKMKVASECSRSTRDPPTAAKFGPIMLGQSYYAGYQFDRDREEAFPGLCCGSIPFYIPTGSDRAKKACWFPKIISPAGR